MLRPMLSTTVIALHAVWLVGSGTASAQRDIPGATDDEDEDGDSKPATDKKDAKEEKKEEKKEKTEKKGDKKDAKEEKKSDKKDAKEEKKEQKKGDKKDAKVNVDDVLGETASEKKKRDEEDKARKAAERADDAAQKKKDEADAATKEKKKEANEKRLKDSRESRLASAKKVRPLLRNSGAVVTSIAIEPGAVVKNTLTEIRFDIGKKLEVEDARYGNREPLKNLQLTAVVMEATGKKDAKRVYALHSLGAPGQYGFHFTPTKDQVLQVQVVGNTADGAPVDATFSVPVGQWPPPDFDDEERKLLKAAP
jgi:hypothetical protein